MQTLLVANRFRNRDPVLQGGVGARPADGRHLQLRRSLLAARFKADEAFLIGPAEGGQPVRSYLSIDDIVGIARQNGIDAIHPGYGFLAENADFARACEAEGIQFIGPTSAHLEMFGDKTAARQLAEQAGIPTVPGTPAAVHTAAAAATAADHIGYPVIIKAQFRGRRTRHARRRPA